MDGRGYNWERSLFDRLGIGVLLSAIAAQKNLIFFSLGMILLCYGYDIFNFSLRIDSEWYSLSEGVKPVWLGQGRWGMYWLSYWLLADSVMPTIPALITILGLAAGGLCWLASMAGARGLPHYLAMAILISCPIYYFVSYFTVLGYGVGVGCLLVGAATYVLMKKNIYWLPLVIVCYTAATGIYQALLPVTAVAFGVSLLDHHITRRNDYRFFWRKSASYLVSLLLALLLYWYMVDFSLSNKGRLLNESYLSSFTHLPQTPEQWLQSFSHSLTTLFGYYAGSADVYLYWLYGMVYLTLAVTLIFLLRVLLCQRSIAGGILSLLLFSLILLVPIPLLVMNGGVMPPRTQIALVWILAGTVYLAARMPSLLARALLTVLVVCCSYKFAVVVNRYSFASDMQWEADKVLSVQLLSALNGLWLQLPAKHADEFYPLELVGIRDDFETPMSINRDAIGASFFNWDEGRAIRVVSLFTALGNDDYRAATDEERQRVADRAQSMPDWPVPGSVQVIEGVVVVKLAAYTARQRASLCGADRTGRLCP